MSNHSDTSRRFFVLSALGSDRPGIVAEVTELLQEHGCNVEESRMSILGGEFGLLMLVSASEGSAKSVSEHISELEASGGLEIRWKSTEAPQEHRTPDAIPYQVKAYAIDHEGIIHAISEALSNMKVNIVTASTTSYPAPISGTPLFQMEMAIDVPKDLDLAAVRQQMDLVARNQHADIEISFVEGH